MAGTDLPQRPSTPDGGDVPAVPEWHERYRRRINAVGGVFAAVGGLLAAVLLVMVVVQKPDRMSVRLLLAPLSFGFGGYLFGMSVMCLFAPSDFLRGPVGRPWMKMIGTRSVIAARIACTIFGLIGTAVGFGLGFLFVMMAFGN